MPPPALQLSLLEQLLGAAWGAGGELGLLPASLGHFVILDEGHRGQAQPGLSVETLNFRKA